MAIATDLGYVPPNVKRALERIDVLLLESNHDLEMLKDGPYPWAVKQRVLSRVGHLRTTRPPSSSAAITTEMPRTSSSATCRRPTTLPSLPCSLPKRPSGSGGGCWATAFCWPSKPRRSLQSSYNIL